MSPLSTTIYLRAWGALIVLTGLGTLVSQMSVLPDKIAGLLILAVALFKAWIILLNYLGLRGAPSWRAGGVATLVFSVLVLAGLYGAA